MTRPCSLSTTLPRHVSPTNSLVQPRVRAGRIDLVCVLCLIVVRGFEPRSPPCKGGVITKLESHDHTTSTALCTVWVEDGTEVGGNCVSVPIPLMSGTRFELVASASRPPPPDQTGLSAHNQPSPPAPAVFRCTLLNNTALLLRVTHPRCTHYYYTLQ